MNISGIGSLVSKVLPSVERIVDELHTSAKNVLKQNKRYRNYLYLLNKRHRKKLQLGGIQI